MVKIITDKEMKIIDKKLSNKKLNQIERNRLSRTIRPKLREISSIDSKTILKKLDYNQKAISIEKNIAKILTKKLQEIDSIILYGSFIQNDYQDYNDIDILIITRKKMFEGLMSKMKKIKELREELNKKLIKADIEIISKDNFIKTYKNSPTLIYQLKDCKIIYGKIKIPKKIQLYNANLHMKLDWSKIDGIEPTGEEIYAAIRNAVLVRLLLNGVIDNKELKESINNEIGKNLILRLKKNQETKTDRRIALLYLKDLINKTRSEIGENLWEKIKL